MKGTGWREKQQAVSPLHGGNGLVGVGAWEKAKDADAFAFSLDGSATFAIVRNKGDFLKKIRGSGCPHFFLDHGVFEAKVLCSWHEGTACSGFFS